MNIPQNLKYTREHEWIEIHENIATVGITDFAQSELGDIVFIEFLKENSACIAGETIATIEAVKTVADLFAPVKGLIIDINSSLEDSPDLINSDPYGTGWIIKVKVSDSSQYDSLMSSDEYEEFIK